MFYQIFFLILQNKFKKMFQLFDDEYFMRKALQEAETAYDVGEIPVGTVIVIENQIIAKAYNLTERLTDVTAHAEMQAITMAASYLGGKYLKNCTLYVTLEPCAMCAGALYWSQISRIVYGASDPHRGFSAMNGKLHPKTEIKTGVLETECAELLKLFFTNKRKKISRI